MNPRDDLALYLDTMWGRGEGYAHTAVGLKPHWGEGHYRHARLQQSRHRWPRDRSTVIGNLLDAADHSDVYVCPYLLHGERREKGTAVIRLFVHADIDGDLEPAARHAATDLRRAISLLRPKYEGLTTETLLVSSPAGVGVAEVWAQVRSVHDHLSRTGQLDRLRAGQAQAWLWDEIRAGLAERFRRTPAVADELPALVEAVRSGRIAPTAAAQDLLDRFTLAVRP